MFDKTYSRDMHPDFFKKDISIITTCMLSYNFRREGNIPTGVQRWFIAKTEKNVTKI